MMTVFDRAWFTQYQRSLLAALNCPGLGREFRAALGINRHERVTQVLPHAAIVAAEPSVRVATFYSMPVMAHRFHAEYLPIWKMLHWFDLNIANRLVPAWNLGFDTLTRFPDADPESTSVDGWVGRISVDETFATIRAGAGSGGVSDSATEVFLYLRASAITDQYDQLRRILFLFDTSALGLTAEIISATLSLWGISQNDALGTTDLVVVASNPAANDEIALADFSTLGTTSFGAVTYAAFNATNSAYTPIVLNSSGLTAVSKNGITKYGARLGWDQTGTFGGTWTTGGTTYFQFNMAENAIGTARAPQLVVTYDVPTNPSAKILIGRV